MNHTLVEVTQYEVDADVAKHLISSDWSRAASNKGARHTALPTMSPNGDRATQTYPSKSEGPGEVRRGRKEGACGPALSWPQLRST